MRPRPVLPALALAAVLAFAGCLQQNGDGGPAREPTFQANDEFGMGIAAVTLHGELRIGTAKTWTLRAENKGEPGGNTFEYNTGCGDAPWSVALLGPGGAAIAWRETPVTCAGFETREFSGGDTLPFTWTWNGRMWDSATDSFRDAPKGAYQLRVTFHAMHAGTHESDANAVVGFHVV